MQSKWLPIEDYEADPQTLSNPELRALPQVWIEQKRVLGESGGIERFHEKLRREWAIETGLIERLYALDRGTTELLIEHGIHAAHIPHHAAENPQQAIDLIADQHSAIDSLFAFVKSERELTTSYIKELHSLFTRHQEYAEGRDPSGQPTRIPLLRGDYKQHPNNPTRPDGSIHAYCPPEHVAAEMDRLIELHHSHADAAPEVEAAWLHHRFAQIHPFQDGNGRIARALATLVFIKADWLPLVVRDADRACYIRALEAADGSNLGPLASLFAGIQRRQFVNVIGIARDTEQQMQVGRRIASIRKQLRARRDSLERQWQKAVSNAEQLREIVLARIEEVREELAGVLDGHPEYECFADDADDADARSHYFRRQIVATAKSLGYFANLPRHRSWARLAIRDGSHGEMLFSFHCIGQQFQGVLGCSATWVQRLPTENGMESGGDAPLCDEVFQINYLEPLPEIEERFREWLEHALERGLAMWESTTF